MAGLFRLYVVTDRILAGGENELLDRLAQVAKAGGARVGVQLREKDLAPDALLHLARRVVEVLKPHGTRLLVNDRADIARAAGADGVHLGATSITPADARLCLPKALIGRSTHSAEEARRARKQGADFAVFGPVFATPSKAEHGPPQGYVALEAACAAAEPMPVFAIGGVGADEIPRCVAAGASGVAAVRGLLGVPDPGEAVRRYLAAVGA